MTFEPARERKSPATCTEGQEAPAHAYRAFGLSVASTVPLTPLSPALPSPPDVTIRWGNPPTTITEATLRSPAVEGRVGELLIQPVGGPRLWIREGREIIIDQATVHDAARLESWITTSALGAVLHQRDLFPLHASAIVAGDELVLFTGDRRAGKSTLMSALVKRGYPCAADDVVAIERAQHDGSPPLAYPGLTRARLWRDSAGLLDIDLEGCAPIEPGAEKHFVTHPSASEKKRPIRAIYALTTVADGTLTFERLSPLQAVATAMANLYRPQFTRAQASGNAMLQIAAALAQSASLTRVSRPLEAITVNAIVEQVVNDLSSPG